MQNNSYLQKFAQNLTHTRLENDHVSTVFVDVRYGARIFVLFSPLPSAILLIRLRLNNSEIIEGVDMIIKVT